MTLREFEAKLTAFVIEHPEALDYPVETEGCDCLGPCAGITLFDESTVIFTRG